MSNVRELVVCSLEEWDDIWRRNQFFADRLLHRYPELRILFVEPPADALHALTSGRLPTLPRTRRVTPDGRLRTFRPLKPLPRRAGPLADAALRGQVVLAARAFGFSHPILWLNDLTYAPLIRSTGWRTVYDVTDDWLRAPAAPRETARLRNLESLALAAAAEVVVCSADLAQSRGADRDVTLIPNAVDAALFRRPQERPDDLPPSPVAVYVGSLHDSRLDVDLIIDLARSLDTLSVALVGPDSLSRDARERLDAEPRISILGPRPYAVVPAYLQHADVIVVPHLVNPFTESLDPIKAYECLAVGPPTVATPVAGFRELDGALTVVDRQAFPDAVETALTTVADRPDRHVPGWDERTDAFAAVLERAAEGMG
jgi:teichuronic acid biosynthesis glycosyltransferase TuaH